MGTGDCFILKFFEGKKEKYKMMIDCGTWLGSKEKLTEYIQDLKAYVDNHIDVLVVTHEHKDHVYGFDVCRELLTKDFEIDRIWMGWTEDDKSAKVKKWQKDFGDKKKALAIATNELQLLINDPQYAETMKKEYDGKNSLSLRQGFVASLNQLNELHNDIKEGNYVGGLAGMKVVKDEIAKNNIDYLGPGDIIDMAPDLEGIKIYVLGPPQNWEKEINVQTGGKGESYDHNKELDEDDAFAAAVHAISNPDTFTQPFDAVFIADNNAAFTTELYDNPAEAWRKIDTEWLNAAGGMALRINSITNNLSLALAIEFEDSGKVMLFPGDAEYGSWASWHNIPWEVPCRNGKPHFTEDLLSRTVFYKVAHHLSHNGTAERLGMDMMTHPDLAAMATLDYTIISKPWKNTMPNSALLKDLLTKTKGRLMVMNEEGLYADPGNKVPLTDKLAEARKRMSKKERQDFEKNYLNRKLYLQYTVDLF